MTNHFVKFDRNWADEMDVNGVRILDDTGIAQLHAWVDSGKNSFWFGTNEGFEAGEIDINDFEITEISDDEIDVLTKFFPWLKGTYGYGNFPYIDEIDEDY